MYIFIYEIKFTGESRASTFIIEIYFFSQDKSIHKQQVAVSKIVCFQQIILIISVYENLQHRFN